MTTTLLSTKLYAPPLRASQVSRPGLLELLDAALQPGCRLILVSAPAGFGKTTVLNTWLQSRSCSAHHEIDDLAAASVAAGGVAWLSLDESDNSPIRFLDYLIGALRLIDTGIGDGALAALKSTPATSLEGVLTSLVNDLHSLTAAGPSHALRCLVLDDYHLMTDPEIHRATAFLVEHLPPTMRLALTTRADPPLPLSRLRVRGEMVELRAKDLRFSHQEATTFLNQVMGLKLSEEDVAALEDRTEGWIAGLQVAALSLQGVSEAGDFVRDFTGGHRYVFDYLVEEVLERQPVWLQDFLLRTSILDRLTGPLCDAILMTDDRDYREQGETETNVGPLASQRVLERLEQANLFAVPLDNQRLWYRYHRLFGELLRARLTQVMTSEAINGLHLRASVWYEEQGMLHEAVRYAQAAQDISRLTEVLETHGMDLLMKGELVTLLSWISSIPEQTVKGNIRICVQRAWVYLLLGQAQETETWLQQADQLLAAAPLDELVGHVAAIRAYLSSLRGDVDATIESANQSLELLDSKSLGIRAVVHFVLGGAHLLQGQWGEAAEAMANAGRIGVQGGNIHVAVPALNALAGIRRQQGCLAEARNIATDALQTASGPSGRLLPIAAGALSALAELAYEMNDLETAYAQAMRSVKLGEEWGNGETLCSCNLTLAWVHLARKEEEESIAALRRAENLANSRTVSAPLVAEVRICWAYQYMAQGRKEELRRWTRQSPEDYPSLLQNETLTLARVLLYLGQPTEAADRVDSVLQSAREKGLGRVVLAALITKARLLQAQGLGDEAVSLVAEALELAEPEGYVRTFVDEGEDLVPLLHRAARHGVETEYVGRLLAAFDLGDDGRHPVKEPRGPGGLIEPLSDRELEVLGLVAAGLANRQIAEKLIIAVSTVKSHLNTIYGKLGVTSRTQAASRARDLDLL